jgi:hypothetical protein
MKKSIYIISLVAIGLLSATLFTTHLIASYASCDKEYEDCLAGCVSGDSSNIRKEQQKCAKAWNECTKE